MAQKIITDQTAEIEHMEGLLTEFSAPEIVNSKKWR